MARLAPIDRKQAPLLLRLLNWLTRRRYGKEVSSVNTLALSPHLLLPYVMTIPMAHGKGALSPEIRALAMQLVAAKNSCAWCIDYGLASAMEDGISLEKMLAVSDYATDPRFSTAERAALAYAEASTDGGGHVEDAVFDALRPHFSDREIVELTVAVAIENFYNRINGPLGLESQQFCVMPPAVRPAAVGSLAGQVNSA